MSVRQHPKKSPLTSVPDFTPSTAQLTLSLANLYVCTLSFQRDNNIVHISLSFVVSICTERNMHYNVSHYYNAYIDSQSNNYTKDHFRDVSVHAWLIICKSKLSANHYVTITLKFYYYNSACINNLRLHTPMRFCFKLMTISVLILLIKLVFTDPILSLVPIINV